MTSGLLGRLHADVLEAEAAGEWLLGRKQAEVVIKELQHLVEGADHPQREAAIRDLAALADGYAGCLQAKAPRRCSALSRVVPGGKRSWRPVSTRVWGGAAARQMPAVCEMWGAPLGAWPLGVYLLPGRINDTAPPRGPTMTTTKLRLLVLPVLAATAFGVTACGDGVDQSKLNDVKQQGQQIQQDAKDLQQQAKQTAEDVKSGKVSAEEASKQIQDKADKIQNKAKDAASDAIDAVKNDNNIPDSAKQQLEDAQKQLNSSSTK